MSIQYILFFVLVSCTSPGLSWTIPSHIDVSWPPRWTDSPGDRYMTKNGTFLSPNYLDSCLNYRVPSNVTRTPFPVENGRVIFDLTNKTLGNPTNESIGVDLYLPHLYYKYLEPTDYNTGVQNTYKKAKSMWRFKNWQNLNDGGKCFLPLRMTELIVDKDGNALTASDLVGLNATLTFQISNGRDYRTFEQVDECVYVTLTADNGVLPAQDATPCENYDPAKSLRSSATSSPTGSATRHRLNIVWAGLMLLATFIVT